MMADEYVQLCRAAGDVSRETFLRLKAFESEFRRWSARINLAAPSTLPDLWQRHVIDSAQILPLGGSAKTWLDLGSGGGFPGAVLAILLAERADARITLVESNMKKAAFLQTTLANLGALARVVAKRIEDAPTIVDQPDIVTARALAPLDQLLGLSSPWLERGAKALFHKGRDYAAEVANCHDAWQFNLIEHRGAVDESSVVLEISGLARK